MGRTIKLALKVGRELKKVGKHCSKPTKQGSNRQPPDRDSPQTRLQATKGSAKRQHQLYAKQKVWPLTLSVPCGVSRGVTLFLTVISDAIKIRPDVASVEPDRGLVVSASVLVPSRNAIPGWQMIFRYRFFFSYVPVV